MVSFNQLAEDNSSLRYSDRSAKKVLTLGKYVRIGFIKYVNGSITAKLKNKIYSYLELRSLDFLTNISILTLNINIFLKIN